MSKMSDQNETFSEQRKNSPTGNLIVSSPKGWKLFLKVAHLFARNSASFVDVPECARTTGKQPDKQATATGSCDCHFRALWRYFERTNVSQQR